MKALCCLRSFFAVSCLVTLCSCSDNISGTWSGSCINDTAGGITAPITLTLSINGRQVEGYLMIGGDKLAGSGKIFGTISGNSISFQSEGNQFFSHIMWMGEINNDSIVGRYKVEPSLVGVEKGLPPQSGRFAVSKK